MNFQMFTSEVNLPGARHIIAKNPKYRVPDLHYICHLK